MVRRRKTADAQQELLPADVGNQPARDPIGYDLSQPPLRVDPSTPGAFVGPHVGDPAAVWVPIDDIKPWDQNPRKIPEEAIAKVQGVIVGIVWGAPIVARKADGRIIAGHTRYLAAKAAELAKVPVRYVDLDEEKASLLAIADNRLAQETEWDYEKLGEIFRRQDDAAQLALAGFEETEVQSLLATEWKPPEVGELPTRASGAPDPAAGATKPVTLTKEQRATFDKAVELYVSLYGEPAGEGAVLAAMCEEFKTAEALEQGAIPPFKINVVVEPALSRPDPENTGPPDRMLDEF
jgi:hypothetical protein